MARKRNEETHGEKGSVKIDGKKMNLEISGQGYKEFCGKKEE